MAAANATMVSKHPSTIMVEAPATVNKKQEMEAKHDLELERIKNERELMPVIIMPEEGLKYNRNIAA